MRRTGRRHTAISRTFIQWLILAITLAATLFSYGCGGDEKSTKAAEPPATGYSKEIMQQLEYDARVESPQQEGDKLIVNVNEEWVKDANYGSREWTLKDWYTKWQASRGGSASEGLMVVVRHNGKDVDRYSAKGYEPLETKKAN